MFKSTQNLSNSHLIYKNILGNISKRWSNLGYVKLPTIRNEPAQHYAPNSKERQKLQDALIKTRNTCLEIPLIIDGKKITTGNINKQVIPSDHQHTLCKYHIADVKHIELAIESSLKAKSKWESISIEDRLSIFMKAAQILSQERRYELMAALMLGTGKTVWQAEIDGSLELTDFWRFGCKYVEEIYKNQPSENDFGIWNRLQYRPLEGFILAISPFNFVAIGGNLCSAPALMGNTVIWKPASSAILSNYIVYDILQEAGLPNGVINWLPCSGQLISKHALIHPSLAGIHFTGSTAVFREIWKTIGNNIEHYYSYPRIVGETGGKNFHFIHNSCHISSVINGTLRGAFEYQGQKCSATSRVYVPKSIWSQIRDGLIEQVKQIKMGPPEELDSFMTAVIDKKAYQDIIKYIEYGKKDSQTKLLIGGNYNDEKGYFIQPTIFETSNPNMKLMKEEIFGPVLTIYVYNDNEFESTLDICNETSPYALTGSIWANDRFAVDIAMKKLKNACGNLYINDKSTGAVVAQQPFGGARASGTNDKAGWMSLLLRFQSTLAIKENFGYQTSWKYPHMSK